MNSPETAIADAIQWYIVSINSWDILILTKKSLERRHPMKPLKAKVSITIDHNIVGELKDLAGSRTTVPCRNISI